MEKTAEKLYKLLEKIKSKSKDEPINVNEAINNIRPKE